MQNCENDPHAKISMFSSWLTCQWCIISVSDSVNFHEWRLPFRHYHWGRLSWLPSMLKCVRAKDSEWQSFIILILIFFFVITDNDSQVWKIFNINIVNPLPSCKLIATPIYDYDLKAKCLLFKWVVVCICTCIPINSLFSVMKADLIILILSLYSQCNFLVRQNINFLKLFATGELCCLLTTLVYLRIEFFGTDLK